MNVYLITEDHEPRCYAATTMWKALQLAHDSYQRECVTQDDERNVPQPERLSVSEMWEHWERDILQSCELVGELVGTAL